MAREGLLPLLCAVVLFGAEPSASVADDDPNTSIRAVQTALQQGREYLLRNDHARAVAVLESQIARIDGSREYLVALRDAYRGHIQNLRRAGKDAEAQVFARRLEIIDPAAGSAPSTSPTPAPVPPVKVRAKSDDAPPRPTAPKETARTAEDPFETANQRRLGEARALLEQAEQEFRQESYGKANLLYEKAHL